MLGGGTNTSYSNLYSDVLLDAGIINVTSSRFPVKNKHSEIREIDIREQLHLKFGKIVNNSFFSLDHLSPR